MDIKLKIIKETIIVSPNRAATGEIYFEFEDFFFPEKKWNDFVDVILNWWVVEIIDFIQNRKTKCSFIFMDGPFHIDIIWSKENKKMVDFILVQDYTNSESKKIQVMVDDLVSTLKLSINEVLRHCQENNLISVEFEKLKLNFPKLQSLLMR